MQAPLTEAELAEEFNATAAAAYEAFPEELKRLVVLLTTSPDAPVFVSPAIAEKLTNDTAAIRAAVEERAEKMRLLHAAAMARRNYNFAGTTVDMIALKADPAGAFSREYTREMEAILNLDHEIGHHILKNGYDLSEGSLHLAESAASAYAMLRHIQRFGKKALYAGGDAKRAALNIVLRSNPASYTSDSVERAIQVAEEMGDKINGLSLQDTAALAEKIADECHLDDKTLKKISEAFRPVQEAQHKGEYDYDVCRKVISVMKKHRHDADIFRAGQRYFNYHPISFLIARRAIEDSAEQKSPSYWQQAQDFIQNPEAKAPRYGLLRRTRFKL